MKRDTSVRPYSSVGCTATLGYDSDITTILDACIAGYGQVAVQSIVVASGGLATITTTVPHQFFKWEVVRIDGSAVTDWNTDWKIESIVSSTVFTVITDFSAGTVSGDMTVKAAPLIHLTKPDANYRFNGNTLTITNSTTYSTISCTALTEQTQRIFKGNTSPTAWHLIANSKVLFILSVPTGSDRQYGLTIGTNAFGTFGKGYLENDWASYSQQVTSSLGADSNIRIASPSAAWFPSPTYAGQSGTLMSATGLNQVDGQRLYLTVYMASNYNYGHLYPGMYIRLGLVPANGIYDEMLHFSGSLGYGFCIDLRGPWYG